jgi:hypothetical protein
MKITELKTKQGNPRLIKDDKFLKLVNSIKDFPKMLELRPIIYDPATMEILGGNMRYNALKELKYKDIPDNWIKAASELTDDEKRRFLITDNVGFGEFDWEILQNDWDVKELEAWGLDLPVFDVEPDENELIGIEKENAPTLKITFESVEQLQKAENDIQELIDRKYKGAYYSVSCGEL